MTTRLALLPLTEAGEVRCEQCRHRHESYITEPRLRIVRLCSIHRTEDDRSTRTDGMRLPQCLSAERDAARLRKVEVAAKRLVDAADACDREAERHPSSRSSAPVVRSINAFAALRAALKE